MKKVRFENAMCQKKQLEKCDVCSDCFLFAIFLQVIFFAIFARVAFFLRCLLIFFCKFCSRDYCSNGIFFCDFRSRRFFWQVLFTSLYFVVFVQIAFFYLRWSFQPHFSCISFGKFGDVNLPTHFCKSQIGFFNINFQLRNCKKSDFAGHHFFFKSIFVPSAFSAPFVWWVHGTRVKRNFVAFLSMRPRVNRIFPSFGISLSCFSIHVAPCCMQATRRGAKDNVVAKNAAKRVLPDAGSWPEGKVSRYSHILCAVVQWGLDASTVFQRIQRDALDKWRKGKWSLQVEERCYT